MDKPLNPTQIQHVDHVLETLAADSMSAKSGIAASWTRSYQLHKLAPDEVRQAHRCKAPELARRRDAAGRLLKVATPTIDRLFLTLKLSGCSVVLCDTEGVILHGRRRDGDAGDFAKAGLEVGEDWSENVRGTNGIGTCIAEKRRAVILRDQHYHARHIGMSCFGAPVFNSHGDLQAVLDISTCRENLDPAIQAMISQAILDAAAQIEADHFCDEFADLRIIQTSNNTARAPSLLAVDSYDLVLGATRSARKRFNLPLSSDFNPTPAADLIGDAQDRGIGLESAERRELKRALARADGNMSAAAKALGISRATLYRRMTRAGLRAEN